MTEKSFQIFDNKNSWLMKLDYLFLFYRLKRSKKGLDFFFNYIANIDRKLIFWVSSAIYLYVFNTINEIALLVLTVIISDQLCRYILKKNIRRFRPKTWFLWGNDNLHKEYALKTLNLFEGYSVNSLSSMCSSHASNFFASALLLTSLNSHWPLICFSLCVGIGRFYIGAHWVSDVIVGFGVGTLTFFLILLLKPYIQLESFF